MKDAIKITVVLTHTYVPNPKYYEAGMTIDQMAQVDTANIEEDSSLFMDSDPPIESISYEIVQVPEDPDLH